MKQDGEYEVEWYFETKADWETKPGAYDGLYTKEATSDQITTTIEYFSTFLSRMDSRWADGRTHVAYRDVTAADFNLLAFYTSVVTNPGLYNP